MQELGSVTDNDVVLAFLRAEIDSETWGPTILSLLKKFLRDRRLIDEADLTDYPTNGIRKAILADYRGFGLSKGLFENFPEDTTWRRVLLADVSGLKYINHPPFGQLTGGTRSVLDGIRTYKTSPDTAKKVDNIVQELEGGAQFEDLVLVEDPNKKFVIIEGNHRATAYAIKRIRNIRVLVGTSPTMKNFRFI
jgi:hypothetical protein